MRIVFLVLGNSRRSNYLNGDTIRTGGGGASGTDGSNILVAEYLAANGFDVTICTELLEPKLEEKYRGEGKNPPNGSQIRGVHYTDFDFTGIDNRTYDIVVSNLWFDKYNDLPITVTRGLLYWSHMQWMYGVRELVDYANKSNVNLGIVNISKWEKEMTGDHIKGFHKNITNDVHITTIGNPVADDIITEVNSKNIPKKKGKFVYHAAWARGGNVAVDAVRKIDIEDKEFHAFDYLMATHDHKDNFFHMHNGVDKHTLFHHLAEAEYFLYPLYTPYHDVHKDTFSCVVAEAIALGVVPITFPLGALPELFSGYCSWANFPKGKNALKMQSQPLSKDNEEVFNDSTFVFDAYIEAEKTGTLKKHVQNEGYQYIVDNFGIKNIGEQWVNFLKKF